MTYTTNYDLWLEEQIDHLRKNEYSSIDVDNLILELEALGRAEKSAVKSLVYQILLHMLLIDFWHEESKYNKNHWLAEIDAFRLQLEDRLTTNLTNLAKDNLPRLYAKARLNAIRKSNVTEDRYPQNCPYTIDEIIG